MEFRAKTPAYGTSINQSFSSGQALTQYNCYIHKGWKEINLKKKTADPHRNIWLLLSVQQASKGFKIQPPVNRAQALRTLRQNKILCNDLKMVKVSKQLRKINVCILGWCLLFNDALKLFYIFYHGLISQVFLVTRFRTLFLKVCVRWVHSRDRQLYTTGKRNTAVRLRGPLITASFWQHT